jgi:thiol-disulfide isomerase/thioredoxin
VFFTCFLGYSIALDGNVGNCGCFGTVLSLSPLESIIKNILMLGLAIYLFKIVEVKKTSRNWILPLMYVFILVAIFASVPIRKNTDHSMPIKGKTHAIFGTIQGFMGGEKANLNQGKKVVGLFSLGCDHCKEVAMKMSILKKQNNLLPYYFIFVGNEKQVPIFFDDIQDTFPYKVLPMQEFLSIVGHQVPVIYILQDGILLYKLTYETFTTDRFLKINKNLIR